MKVICAWCNARIEGSGSLLSHGICRKCHRQIMQPQFDFMENLAPTESTAKRRRPAVFPRSASVASVRQSAPGLFV